MTNRKEIKSIRERTEMIRERIRKDKRVKYGKNGAGGQEGKILHDKEL